MKHTTHAGQRAALLGLALIGLGCGCATTQAGTTLLKEEANPKIQIMFSDGNGTTVWRCAGDDKECTHEGNFAGHAVDFQRAGTTHINVAQHAAECRGSYKLIQIENLKDKPVARVVCAQPAE
jgi:hypothetical protein